MPFAPDHHGWVLLNPGPACTSPRVQQALLRGDLCHRESEFGDLLLGLQGKLRTALNVPSTSGMVLVTGSGTAAMEMAVSSVMKDRTRPLLVVNNGVYGERAAKMARLHGFAVVEVRAEWTQPPDLDTLEQQARAQNCQAIVAVQHETTTGLLNPIPQIADIARRLDIPLVLDAISSMACDPLDIAAWGVDFVVGTANKGLHGLPGISFVCVSQRGRAWLADCQQTSLYLSLTTYLAAQERGDVPFTPAVQICYALDEALNELADDGGTPARIAEYGQRAQVVRQGLRALDMADYLPATTPRSNALTAVQLPAGLSYTTLHDRLKARGYIIYAGQGGLSAVMFRIATMGYLSLATLRHFVGALGDSIA